MSEQAHLVFYVVLKTIVLIMKIIMNLYARKAILGTSRNTVQNT
jgi:hypothetical protein